MDVSNETHNNPLPNGSLSEFYARINQLEHQNEQWKLENMKLYQDNASLLELIQKQNERIKQIRTPDTQKNAKIMELAAELQKTRSERDELSRAQLAMNNTPSQLHENFLHLQGDYVNVLNGYRTLYAEVERLQSQVQLLTPPKHPSKPQPQPQHRPQSQHHLHLLQQQQSRPQVQQHLQSHLYQPQPIHIQYPQPHCPAQRRSAPTLLQPHVQNYVQQHHQPSTANSRLQPSQQSNIQSPPIIRHEQNQQQSLSLTQQAVFERHRSVVQGRQSTPQRSSGSNPAQDSFVDMANLQHHSPLSSGGQPISHPNSKPHANGIQPSSPVILTMADSLISPSRTSFFNKSGSPTPVVASHPPLRETFSAAPISNFNPDPPKIAMPPLNKVPSNVIDSSKPNTSTSVLPTKSPPDIHLKPLNLVRSPRVKDVQIFNTNTFSAETSFSPVEVPVTSQIALGPHQVKSLKRDSPIRSEDHHNLIEQQQKKPRLEGLQSELTQAISVEPVADGIEDTMQIDEDEDEDEDIIEVGPDGLRLVKDCLSDLFGEEGGKEEGRYCKLCIARRDMGYHSDPLKPFVNATNDELQEHCVTEHAEAWDTLRRSV